MSDESKVRAEVNGSEPFAEARGSGAPDQKREYCGYCYSKGGGWWTDEIVRGEICTVWVACPKCRPVLPNSALCEGAKGDDEKHK